MKIRQDELAGDILEADEDILLIPQTTSLVADQREYPFPSDMLVGIKRVEAKLDETNWLKIDNIDITDLDTPTDETNITYNFANLEGECFYDMLRKSIYIYSGTITAVTNGLKMWVNTYPAAITDLSVTDDMSIDPSTTTHGIPRQLHEIWARGVIIDYKESKQNPIPLSEREGKYEYDKHNFIQKLKSANKDRDVIGTLPPSDERWNDGADL